MVTFVILTPVAIFWLKFRFTHWKDLIFLLLSIHPIIHIAVFCTTPSESFCITRDYLYPKSLVVQWLVWSAVQIMLFITKLDYVFPSVTIQTSYPACCYFQAVKFFSISGSFFRPQAHILFYRWLLSHYNNLHTLSCMWRLVATFKGPSHQIFALKWNNLLGLG
jgi:hypothetical protein